MNSLEGAFETNMKTKKITRYVKFQMDETPAWNIESISVDGTGGYSYTYSIKSQKPWVMYPDESTIEDAKKDIQTILDGKKLKQAKKDKDDSADSKNDTNSKNDTDSKE